MNLRSIWVVVTIALAGFACEKDSKPLNESEYPRNVGDPPIVSIQNAGRTPQQTLRLRPAVDTEQKVELRLEMAMGGAAAAMPSMDMAMHMSSKVGKVEDNGTFHQNVSIDSVKFDNPELAGMGLSDMLSGMKVSQITSDRGIITGGSIDLPPKMAMLKPMFDDSMKQLAFSLPEGPVGVGATWTTKETLEKNSMRIYQEITFKITELDKTRAKLDMTMKQQALRQDIEMMGQKMTLEKLSSSGSGTAVLTFDKPMPTAMNLTIKVSTAMKVGDQRATVDMTMKMDMTSN